MKKKASGTYRARVNARGFEQIDGEHHYDKTHISLPVVNEITVRMILILIWMARWCAMLLDVKGAFSAETSKMPNESTWKFLKQDSSDSVRRTQYHYY
jgi:hypothetical protein